MSADPTFDRHVTELLRVSTRNPTRYPGDPDWTDETWERKVRVLVTLVYRAGAQAGLTHQFGRLDTTIERVRWLVERDLVNVDVSELLREVENLRETDRSLMSRYGVTDGMPHDEWGGIVDFVAGPLIDMLREAEEAARTASGHRAYEQFYRNADQEPPPWELESETVRQSWIAIAVAAAVPAGDSEQENGS